MGVRGELGMVLSIVSCRGESRQERSSKETFVPALGRNLVTPAITRYSQHEGRRLIPIDGESRWHALRTQALAQGIADTGSSESGDPIRTKGNFRAECFRRSAVAPIVNTTLARNDTAGYAGTQASLQMKLAVTSALGTVWGMVALLSPGSATLGVCQC
jgi:hypothetical protein